MPLTQIAFSFDDDSLPEKKQEQKIIEKKIKPVENKMTTKAGKSTRGRMSVKAMEATVDLIEVPDDAILFEKSYYSMNTVAKMFKVNQSLLRFWQNEFNILQPKKNGKGDRLFRPEDVKNLKLIYHLLREKKIYYRGG